MADLNPLLFVGNYSNALSIYFTNGKRGKKDRKPGCTMERINSNALLSRKDLKGPLMKTSFSDNTFSFSIYHVDGVVCQFTELEASFVYNF